MLKNYITTAVRSLLRNKGFSAINIIGLSIGLASFILISSYIYHELSFDRYHKNADRIVRIVENLRTENELLLQGVSSPSMGPMFQKDYPEVQKFVRFQKWDKLVARGEQSSYERDIYIADSSVFDVFSWELVKGDPKTALKEPSTVVLTESAATKYFGDEDPVGEMLKMDEDLFKVTGVMKDIPENSHFTFNMLLSFETWSSRNRDRELTRWFSNGYQTYLLLDKPESIEKLRAAVPEYITRNIPKGGMYYEDLPLQPLASIYLETPRTWEHGQRGSLNNIYILSAIAAVILVIASFNYINLATARASRRLKEVGLRKVLGAQRRMLVAQFIGESLIVTLVASVVGLIAAWLALPWFSSIIDAHISFAIFGSTWNFIGAITILALIIGIVSGTYPAMVISGFQPLQIFRQNSRSMFGQHNFRKVLVTAQFVISITLVAGTILVYDQLSLVRNTDLGFVKTATLVISTNGDKAILDHMESVRGELLKVNGVTSVTGSAFTPGGGINNLFTQIESEPGKMTPTNINYNFVDHDFIPAYKIKLLAGRNFSRDNKADDTTAYIVNMATVRTFGWTAENAIGRKIDKGRVIGVVDDYRYESLHHPVQPMLMVLTWGLWNISVQMDTEDVRGTVASVGNTWSKLAPHLPFDYKFLDESYDKLYKADAQLGKVAVIFTLLAIFVGSLGLLGLTSFAVERRVKEIGIRKVLGASVRSVVALIASEFVILIMAALFIAVPITWYLVNKWLMNFNQHIDITVTPFAIAGVLVLITACLTISWLSFRAATANPTKSLRVD